MAKNKVTIGPTQDTTKGYNEGSDGLPSNPADTLRTGSVPIKTSPQFTGRRSFSVPYRPSLHRYEGLSSDEFNQPGHEESVGENRQPYAQGSNLPTTEEGQPVRGT